MNSPSPSIKKGTAAVAHAGAGSITQHVASKNHEDRGMSGNIQLLVKLDNCKTYCLNFLKDAEATTTATSSTVRSSPFPIPDSQIIAKLSHVSGIPNHMLRLYNNYSNQNEASASTLRTTLHTTLHTTTSQFFLSAYTFLPIRGGKGGFGTLLKGISKQAGARMTVDFGQCRDLSGRRLRHVNDEIKLRKWREGMQKRLERSMDKKNSAASGDGNDNDNDGGIDIEDEINQLKTASGIRNWHLMVPNWSDMGQHTSKSKRKVEQVLRREVEKLARKSRQEYQERKRKKDKWEDSIMSYVNAGAGDNDSEEYAKKQEEKMTNSILEGMNKRKKRKLGDGSSKAMASTSQVVNTDTTDHGNESESLLSSSTICTLSGEVVLEDETTDSSSNNTMMIQSKSEFATSAILLNSSLFNKISDKHEGLYYEVTIKSCGISQIGWASISTTTDGSILPSTGKDGFLPNSDTGDGVGDDQFSYGFDGSRGLTFHNGQEKTFGKDDKMSWKSGDVIGCSYSHQNEIIEYSINGKSLGVAFNEEDSLKKQLLHPVFSLNENEIVGLNLGPTFEHCPPNYLGVSTLSCTNINAAEDEEETCDTKLPVNDKKPSVEETEKIKKAFLSKDEVKKHENINVKEELNETTLAEKFDLSHYGSAEELEKVGPDRLKKELFKLGCKCGGSPQERAARLFSLKGLKRVDFPQKVRGKNFKV